MKTVGKKKCETLKAVRQRIADANDIEYTPCECHHEGDCPGTCPRCEAEMRYIEGELAKKRQRNLKRVAAAITTGAIIAAGTLASCGPKERQVVGEMAPPHIDSVNEACTKDNLTPDDTTICYEQEAGDVVAPTEIDESMVGKTIDWETEVPDGDSIRTESVKILITKEMVGDAYDDWSIDSTSAFGKAVKEATEKAKKGK